MQLTDQRVLITGGSSGGLTLLINNAAVQQNYTFLGRLPDDAVVNLTTGLALSPKRTAAGYCAAKAGLRTFTKALRYQLEADAPHVRAVDAVLPVVDTPMTAGRGTRKISAVQAAEEILDGLRRDRDDVLVGRVATFALLHRIAPRRADALLENG